MRILKTVTYTTTVIADKNKIFTKNRIIKSNILSEDELKTLQVINKGNAIKWTSNVPYNKVTYDHIKERFYPLQIDRELSY